MRPCRRRRGSDCGSSLFSLPTCGLQEGAGMADAFRGVVVQIWVVGFELALVMEQRDCEL